MALIHSHTGVGTSQDWRELLVDDSNVDVDIVPNSSDHEVECVVSQEQELPPTDHYVFIPGMLGSLMDTDDDTTHASEQYLHDVADANGEEGQHIVPQSKECYADSVTARYSNTTKVKKEDIGDEEEGHRQQKAVRKKAATQQKQTRKKGRIFLTLILFALFLMLVVYTILKFHDWTKTQQTAFVATLWCSNLLALGLAAWRAQ
jgi:hypothetical protein